MTNFFRSRISSFKYAFSGLFYVIRTQKNAWVHLIVMVIVISLSFWFNLSAIEWTIILLTIAMVWAAEFINSSLEAIVDLASPQKHPLSKIGKDVGAAAVLIASFFAAIIGFIILLPPLINKLIFIFSK